MVVVSCDRWLNSSASVSSAGRTCNNMLYICCIVYINFAVAVNIVINIRLTLCKSPNLCTVEWVCCTYNKAVICYGKSTAAVVIRITKTVCCNSFYIKVAVKCVKVKASFRCA